MFTSITFGFRARWWMLRLLDGTIEDGMLDWLRRDVALWMDGEAFGLLRQFERNLIRMRRRDRERRAADMLMILRATPGYGDLGAGQGHLLLRKGEVLPFLRSCG